MRVTSKFVMAVITVGVLVLGCNISIAYMVEPPETRWTKTYGGFYNEEASVVVETSDGGYVILGYTYPLDGGDYDFWLVKTDSNGNMQWNRTYGGVDDDIGSSILESSTGGYVITGFSFSFGAGQADVWLLKLDFTGSVEWNRTYGGAGSDMGFSIVETDDGGYVIAGRSSSFGLGDLDFWVFKVDSSGTMLWNKTYGEANQDSANVIIKTADGGFALTGWKDFGTGNTDFLLVKTDSNGNMQWNRTYGGVNDELPGSIIQTADGGYALAGYTTSFGNGGADIWLIKLDSFGIMEWNKTHGGALADLAANSLVETGGGGYVIAGTTQSFGSGGADFWLVGTDSSGAMMWNKTYGGIGWETLYSMIHTSDGGFALAGLTESYGAGGCDFWLIKTEPPLMGDITGPEGQPDGRVDMWDVSYVARRFQVDPADPLWDPNADINHDDKIDMKDIGTTARNFGETYP